MQVPEITANPVKQKKKSSYFGVSYYFPTSKWKATVYIPGQKLDKKCNTKHVGYYKTEDEAAEARNNYIKNNNLDCKLSGG
jgi:hypothetical protein